MLPFKNRLTKRKDFEQVQRAGAFFSEDNLALKLAKNNLQDTRVGFVVGMRFSKKAVERNQAKRVLREIFREKMRELAKGFDVVVTARRREGEKVSPEKLRQNAVRVLEKSTLLKAKSEK